MTLPETEHFPTELRVRYEPLSTLGQGGMGRVFRVRDLKMNRSAALKLLLKAGDKMIEERFLREAKIGSRLRHPNIVETYDFGFVDGCPFLVLEYVDGRSLEKGLAGLDAAAVMLDVAEALTALHGEGTIHRDVKPANVMVANDGRVLLADFGLARDPDQTSLTGTGAIVGTVAYLAPELLRGEPVTTACDWWAWGVTLYELNEGGKPFPLDDLVAFASRVDSALPALSFKDPASPAARMIQACLVSDPRARPRSASQLRACASRPTPRPGLAPLPASALPSQVAEPSTSRMTLLRALAGLAVVLGIAFSVSTPGDSPAPPPPSKRAGPSRLIVLANATAAELEDQPALSDPDPWVWARAREVPSLAALLDEFSDLPSSDFLSDTEFAALERVDEVITRAGASPLLEVLLATKPATEAFPRPPRLSPLLWKEPLWDVDLPPQAKGYLGTAYRIYPEMQRTNEQLLADLDAFLAKKPTSAAFPFSEDDASLRVFAQPNLLEARFLIDPELRRRSRAWVRPAARHASAFYSAIGASLRHEPESRLAALTLATSPAFPRYTWLSHLAVVEPVVLLGGSQPRAEVQIIRAMLLGRQWELRRRSGDLSGDLSSPIQEALRMALEEVPPGFLGDRQIQLGFGLTIRLASRQGTMATLAPLLRRFLSRLLEGRSKLQALNVLRQILEVWDATPAERLFDSAQAKEILAFLGDESPLWPDVIRPDIEARWRRRLEAIAQGG